MSKPVQISESMFEEAHTCLLGFCTQCETFTTESVSLNATKEECETCGDQTVYGVEAAVMTGVIQIEE